MRKLEKIAKGLELLAITNHAPAHHRNGVCYGGTMIVIPYSAIERKENESLHAACERIKSTQHNAARGRFTSVTMTVSNRQRKLVAAYAPSDPQPSPPTFL